MYLHAINIRVNNNINGLAKLASVFRILVTNLGYSRTELISDNLILKWSLLKKILKWELIIYESRFAKEKLFSYFMEW